MVCYARPAIRLAAILVVAWLVFARPVSHFFDTAALMVAVTVATAGAAVAAALVFAAFMSARRRRASTGGCVSCQFRCQHAMTERRRPWLVTTTDRSAPGHVLARPGAVGRRGEAPARSVPVLLPVPAVRSAGTAGAPAVPGCGPAVPRWPDRPVYRSSQAGRAARVPVRARAGSPA